MKNRKEIENRITLFMTNIRKGLSYDANVVLLTNDIEEAIKQGQTLPINDVSQQRELLLGFQKSEYFDLYEQGVLEYKDAIEKYLA